MTRARPVSRHRSREAALQALYAADLGRKAGAPSAEEALAGVAANFELPAGALAFAKELVTGVEAELEVLDAQIGAAAQRWRVERMAVVDRNILRLAAWEMLFGGRALEVAIDEAVELAHRFGDDASPRFVNGVLDSLAQASGAERRASS